MQLPFELLMGGSYRCTPKWGRREAVVEDCHRCYFPRHGHAWMERGGERADLRPGRICLIPGYRPITFGCDDVLELDWLHFRAADMVTQLKLARLAAPVVWPASRWRCWLPVYRRLDELFANPHEPPLPQQVQAMLLCLIGDLLPRLDSLLPGALHRDLRRLQPALVFMDAQFQSNPPLAEIAERVHLSPTHFHRRFRRALRMSPRHYMLCRRMELARQLLRHGDMNVSEVARACGYETVFHFSRVFTTFYHCPPSTVLRSDAMPMP